MKPSLQRRMLITVIMGMTVVLILFDAVLYVTIRSGLLGQIKASLSTTADLLAASVEINSKGLDLEMALEKLPDFHNPHQPLFFQISDARGQIVAKSPNLGSAPIDLRLTQSTLPVFMKCWIHDLLNHRHRRHGTGPHRMHGHPAYALSIPFTPRVDNDQADNDVRIGAVTKDPYHLIVARDSWVFWHQLSMLRWILGLVSAVVLILSVAIAWMVVRQGLRPLHSVATQIAGINAHDLSSRVGSQSTPVELSPIIKRLNNLLEHLQDAFEHERRFTADAAHELRTPLAGLRSVLEVALSRPREAPDYRAALEECSGITTGMQTLVENLLTLARLEARSLILQNKQFNLLELVDRCWLTFTRQAEEKGVTLSCSIDPTSTLQSDPDFLVIILTNLFSNAVEYTPTGGHITAAATQTQDGLQLAVSNTGCTLTNAEVEHVFDCFWRADTSRTDTGLHCGLGLALVQRMVEALGGRVTATVTDGLFTVQIMGIEVSMSKN